MGQEAEGAQAVIYRHAHDALASHAFAVVAGFGAIPGHPGPAVEIHEHRQLFFSRLGGRPHVQVQAILAHALGAGVHVAKDRQLHGLGAELLGFAHTGPTGERLGLFPAQRPDRGLGKGNAFKRADATRFRDAFEHACRRSDLRGRGGFGLLSPGGQPSPHAGHQEQKEYFHTEHSERPRPLH